MTQACEGSSLEANDSITQNHRINQESAGHRHYSEASIQPQNESEASQPQALFLWFVTFTPSHEITLGMRATGTISKVPPNHSPLDQRAAAEAAESHQEPRAQGPPLLKKGLPYKNHL